MDKDEYKYDILGILTRYYDNDRDRALEIYTNKHNFFRDHLGTRMTMEEVVENGNGEEVLNFLDMVLL